MTIYVVEGSTGEYSDHREWPVVAFRNETEAQAHVTALEVWLREHRVFDDQHDGSIADYDSREGLKHPLDPSFQVDYTGTRYYYFAVELR